MVQAGKKTQDGGLKVGFSSKKYQPSREDAVNMEPITPAN
jgi:hypothetical protein